MYLMPTLEKLLWRKLGQNSHVRCDDTNVVVSVTDRTERELVKRFDHSILSDLPKEEYAMSITCSVLNRMT
jgi:hypothetical protein